MRESNSLRTQILQVALGVATATALIVAQPGAAQGMPGGGGMGHGGRGGHSGQDRNPSANRPEASAAHVPNPLRAMLVEMPRLRTDLLLTTAQIASWSAMEDALRSSVELGRSRMPVPVATAAGTDAELFVQDLADSESALSESLKHLATTMKVALGTLNARQSKLVQERFAAAIDVEVAGGLH